MCGFNVLVRMWLVPAQRGCSWGNHAFNESKKVNTSEVTYLSKMPALHAKHAEHDQDSLVGEQHVVHYPLNGLELDFLRYSPHLVGAKSLMANHIFQDYLFPARLTPDTYVKRRWHLATHGKNALMPVRRQDQRLYDEYLALDKARTFSLLWDKQFSKYNMLPRSRDGLARGISLENAVIDIMQRFFLETNVRWRDTVFMVANRKRQMDELGHPRNQTQGQTQGQPKLLDARNFPQLSQENPPLYQGPDPSRSGVSFFHILDLRESILKHEEIHLMFVLRTCEFDQYPSPSPVLPHTSRRGRSLPDLRRYSTAGVIAADSDEAPNEVFWFFSWPSLSLQELDCRTRRRSLSRRHIARLFQDEMRPRLNYRANREYDRRDGARCTNCTSVGHTEENCVFVCGHCGKFGHHATSCQVPKDKRCKCSPFPRFHRGRDCFIKCSRPCGNPYPPGHQKHANAMTCKYRCCMCGIRGHSGLDCNLRKCRCKGTHLGQDCSWNPTCRVKGCDRFLCGIHCRECGSRERPFVGWRCAVCLNNGEPVGAKADEAAAPTKSQEC